jgi:hypothetical protein
MLYQRALGPSFDALPPALQRLHAGQEKQVFEGTADLRQGHAIARLLVGLAGFPKQAGQVPIRLTITQTSEGEIWDRSFGGHATRSLQWLAQPGVIAERVGLATILMRPRVDDTSLRLPIVGLRGLMLPLPAWLMPGSGGVERVADDGALLFDVTATARFLGPMIRYTGDLRPVT